MKYGLLGLGGMLELGMGVVLIALYPGRPLMVIGVVLALAGGAILAARLRGERRARSAMDRRPE